MPVAGDLPVAVIGAGPVGLAAAAHLLRRGLPAIVFEAGEVVGHNVAGWGHVRLFSPWEMDLDEAAVHLLGRHGWRPPERGAYPRGSELVERYLRPLAETPELRPLIRLSSRVACVTRHGLDKLSSAGRESAPFELVVDTPEGAVRQLARAVIDASGTIGTPGFAGADGLPAEGEGLVRDRIAYGHPDVLGASRARYRGRRTLVLGSGHSALGAIRDLLRSREEDPRTEALWALRRTKPPASFHAPARDALPERGRLAAELAQRLDAVRVYTGFAVRRLTRTPAGIVAASATHHLPAVDEVIVATGYRPDLAVLRELRVEIDPAVESPRRLAPLIDPERHSCGTVPPHGVDELTHPDPGLFIVGMKSYGRAPTFLMKTGYEQVRSIAAALAGDWESARRVELVLPETGVCSGPAGADRACCVSAAPAAAR